MPSLKDRAGSTRKINRRIEKLASSIDSIYRDTYKSRIDNKRNLDAITNDIESNLDDIFEKINGQDVSDISKLYLRAMGKDTSSSITKSLEELFNADGSLLDTVNLNLIRKSIQAQDYQYDLLCKYMPKLRDALEIKKDNVLSADSFTKEFIHTMSNKAGADNIALFSQKAELIRDKYHFEELVEEIYSDTSKYGEYFLYHVPYRKGFKDVLDRRERNGRNMSTKALSLEGVVWESSNITEENGFDSKFVKYVNGSRTNDTTKLGNETGNWGDVNIKFDFSMALEDTIRKHEMKYEVLNSHQSFLQEAYLQSLETTAGTGVVSEERLPSFDNTGLSPDGITDPKKAKSETLNSDKLRKDINGSIYYKIPRANIVPVYIADTCVGYIYLKVTNDYFSTFTTYDSRRGTMLKNSLESDLLADEWDRQNDMAVGQIASALSDKIDATFINNNLDLKDEIYSILRYNDQFNVAKGVNNISCTFLPAEDVQHFYFKLDPVTHRGISDLENAAVPGMIWCMAYLNDSIARMSRGQDKRVYYVQQNVEKNVAKTMLNVVAQLKKGNMGMRQLQNMNTMFNVVGKFNDYIIPVGPNGESPVRMEVMSGQDVQTPTDLMDRMEEAAIFTTDVPPEFLQSLQQVDYASRFTMSSSKFLRMVLKRQNWCQKQYSITFRKFYNYEFDENNSSIYVRLPAPAYLALANNSQLLNNAKDYSQAILEFIGGDDDDESVKKEFLRSYTQKVIGTYVDFDEAKRIFEEAKFTVTANADPKSMGSSDDDYGDDDEY